MENLKNARKLKNLTQEQLGELVNVQKSAISKYERGAIQPSQDILIRISEVLCVSVDYLLGKIETPNPKPSIISEEDIKVALFDGDKDVTDEMWEEVKSFARFVKQKHKKDNE